MDNQPCPHCGLRPNDLPSHFRETIVTEERSGKQIAIIPDILKQVTVGRDYYVGQQRHVVVKTLRESPQRLLVWINPV